MKVILSGGGTIGSVSPLLAVYEELKARQENVEVLWLGTKNGPEKKLVEAYQIKFKDISSGKLRRYFSFQNFIDPFKIIAGFFQSFFLLKKIKPNVVLSAGGFVSVPTAFAAYLLKIPVMIHQQDIRLGLANKLMIPFAKIITVTFEASLKDFPSNKTTVVGNPVRKDVLSGSKEEAYKFFKLEEGLPVVLIMGGGTGAAYINSLVAKSIKELVSFCQVIHLTGGKVEKVYSDPRYKAFDFLTGQMKNALAVSDLVVTRAGLSTLTELSALAKPSFIIPMPDSHQEENANEFFKNNAAAVASQKNLSPQSFTAAIKELLENTDDLNQFRRNMPSVIDTTAASKIVDMIL